MQVTPHNLREFYCQDCREINLLKPGENPALRQCDDCGKVGTLVPFSFAQEVNSANRRKP
jgi:hypothetical protein